MKSGLVSIAMNCASGAIRSRIERQKVPTPGPYSTNNLVFAQSTGPSILRISRSEDGTIEPTITGCLRKPWKNMPQEEGTPAARRSRLRVAAVVELVIDILTLMLSQRNTRGRSEEHTSELQSLMRTSYAVYCLNKKKNKI